MAHYLNISNLYWYKYDGRLLQFTCIIHLCCSSRKVLWQFQLHKIYKHKINLIMSWGSDPSYFNHPPPQFYTYYSILVLQVIYSWLRMPYTHGSTCPILMSYTHGSTCPILMITHAIYSWFHMSYTHDYACHILMVPHVLYSWLRMPYTHGSTCPILMITQAIYSWFHSSYIHGFTHHIFMVHTSYTYGSTCHIITVPHFIYSHCHWFFEFSFLLYPVHQIPAIHILHYKI